MRGELKKLTVALGGTFIYLTPDQAESRTLSDRVALMNDGRLAQGRVYLVEPMGADTWVTVELGGGRVVARCDGSVGDAVGLRFDAASGRLRD